MRNWRPVFLRELAATGNVAAASTKAKVAVATPYAHKHTDPAFAAAWAEALDKAVEALELEARRRALQGIDEGVWYKGHKVGKLIKYSDTLLIFLLKAHRPEKYRERFGVDHLKIDPREWTDAQLDAYAAGVPLAQVLAMTRAVDIHPAAACATAGRKPPVAISDTKKFSLRGE